VTPPPRAPDPRAEAGDRLPSRPQEHHVRIEPHGRTLRVAAGQAVLEAALASGLNLPHSCKSGHCGSCRARLVSGETYYPEAGLPLGITAEEARNGQILLCQARADSDLTVEARLIASVADVEIKTLPCRIARLNRLAPDVMQVFLRLPTVEHLRFHPGQYLDVLLEAGRRRSFSIASPPHDSELIELHVRRVNGGGFTERLFGAARGDDSAARDGWAPAALTDAATAARLAAGSLLRIEGPMGQFSYREGSCPVLMVAGGTGFAPIKSMLRHVLESGLPRDIHFYWGARHAPDIYEESVVLGWVRRYPKLRFTAVLSEATTAEAAHHRAGWVHEAVLADYPDLAPFEVYAAGPPAMIEAMRAGFPRHGLPAERLYFDSFDYAPDSALR
jgi:CDP-4-dehydro-6-deoxyglucose reductase